MMPDLSGVPWRRRPRRGLWDLSDPPELVEQLLRSQQREQEDDVVDKGHEVVEHPHMPGTQERPVAAPGTVREDPEKAATAIRAALGMEPEETTETVLQEIGLYREHVEKVSTALGLHPYAALSMVLGQAQACVEQAGFWSEVVEALGMESATVEDVLATVRDLHARRVDTDGMVRTATMEEVEQARARRHAALSDVMTMWGQHRLGEEPPLEDILGLAAWLADGDTAPMVDAIRVRAEVYGRQRAGADGDADTARWAPEHP